MGVQRRNVVARPPGRGPLGFAAGRAPALELRPEVQAAATAAQDRPAARTCNQHAHVLMLIDI